ncbi:MAG: SUMF1/EgtB/PvdO family nonheme iron enzyme [Chloroflexi bacterium]|nr:SUMF1/EgtB/PvdO family nonheme iron enzyme [Chloroflexota bacterium]
MTVDTGPSLMASGSNKASGTVVLPPSVYERLVHAVRARLPLKTFGYLLSDGDPWTVTDFVLFESNIRNTGVWKERFERYGQYFVEHDNAGFVATPEEAWQVQKMIWARGMVEVGVFHSHIRHPANFSRVDYDLHVQRFPSLWHLIVSVRNPDLPQLRAFGVSDTGVRELPLVVPPASSDNPALSASDGPRSALPLDVVIRRARRVLALDQHGRPVCQSSRSIVTAIEDLVHSRHQEAIDELLWAGFLRGAEERYDAHIAGLMAPLDGGSFAMGSAEANAEHFMGEVPVHQVNLSPFLLARVPVTCGLLALFDADRASAATSERSRPAVDVTWFDAALFAMWVGCRLPTEAEWEFACGGGSAGQWCCGEEDALSRYAWYSQNAGSEAHPVATRQPNAYGIFDLHGNVWEWCADVYDETFYADAPTTDPVRVPRPAESLDSVHRVCRGGCMHSFAEMCRTRYRFHEHSQFRAADLGFRLARSIGGTYGHAGSTRVPGRAAV